MSKETVSRTCTAPLSDFGVARSGRSSRFALAWAGPAALLLASSLGCKEDSVLPVQPGAAVEPRAV